MGGALAFNWTHPARGTAHVVRFAGDELEAELVAPGLWQVELELEEV
jgi:hypothetical protein